MCGGRIAAVRVTRPLRALGLIVLLAVLSVLSTACNADTGLPTEPGRYVVKEKSISFDGERYSFMWAPPDEGVWAAISPSAADNVYFALRAAEAIGAREPRAGSRARDSHPFGLGVWTTHIVLWRGRVLEAHEITGVYPVARAEPGRSR